MKRLGMLVLIGVLFASFAVVSPAMAQEEEAGGIEKVEGMEGHKGMGKDSMYKKCMKYRSSKQKMVSSEDGGVIILSGHKLMKYDKDLNLVKEVKVESGRGKHGMMKDPEAKKKWLEGKDKCPMCDRPIEKE